MSQIERPARAARWISWLAVVLLMVTVAVAFLSSGREWVIFAAALGLVAAWLTSALLRLERRWLVVAGALLVLVVGAGAAWALWVRPDPDNPSPGAAPPRTMAVRYLAFGELNGTTVVLTETVVLDGTMSILVSPGDNPDPEDWRMGTLVGGAPSLVRTRTFRASDVTLVSSTFVVPLSLGEFPMRTGPATLVPQHGSEVVLTAPTGAFGTATPASTATNPSGDGNEETTIPVNRDVTEFSVTVLAEPMHNPVGHLFYEAVTWGLLPWLIGALVAFVGSVFWDRMVRLIASSGRRRSPGTATPTTGDAGG
jgi:hypothetical protein